MIAIIDYGAGNLHSVQNALSFLGAKSCITSNPDEILSADKVILPGVGSFGNAMEQLHKSKLTDTVKKATQSSQPFLGICLGLHLLFESSEESPNVDGLGVFDGKIVRIPSYDGLKIPHIGWNSIKISKESRLFYGLGNEPFVYFVHSYYANPTNAQLTSARTMYGQELDIAMERDSIFAVQFHPEKSGELGMKILNNFIEL